MLRIKARRSSNLREGPPQLREMAGRLCERLEHQKYPAVAAEEAIGKMSEHKFKVGQTMRFSPAALPPHSAPPGRYLVTAQLPEHDGQYQYHITSSDEPHERVALENELSRAVASEQAVGEISEHKFKVGETVRFSPAALLPRSAPPGQYLVTGQLPQRNGEYRYLITSIDEPDERVVRESDLHRA